MSGNVTITVRCSGIDDVIDTLNELNNESTLKLFSKLLLDPSNLEEVIHDFIMDTLHIEVLEE